MDSVSETIRATRRLLDLAQDATLVADALMDHYRAGHVGESVLDPVSSLVSASLLADRTASALVTFGDDNDLYRSDVVAEEVTRVLLRERSWLQALDEIHGVSP